MTSCVVLFNVFLLKRPQKKRRQTWLLSHCFHRRINTFLKLHVIAIVSVTCLFLPTVSNWPTQRWTQTTIKKQKKANKHIFFLKEIILNWCIYFNFKWKQIIVFWNIMLISALQILLSVQYKSVVITDESLLKTHSLSWLTSTCQVDQLSFV